MSRPPSKPVAPDPRDLPPELLAFTPVPVKDRVDGWTSDRQRGFIHGLALGRGVSAAARAVGMSRQSAYGLRGRAHAAGFAAAWDKALAFVRSRPVPPGTTCYERAVQGVLVPLRHRNRIIGYRREYDGRALRHLLTTVYRLREPRR